MQITFGQGQKHKNDFFFTKLIILLATTVCSTYLLESIKGLIYLPEPLYYTMVGMVTTSVGSVGPPVIYIDVTESTQQKLRGRKQNMNNIYQASKCTPISCSLFKPNSFVYLLHTVFIDSLQRLKISECQLY